jgi:hypothetical protein
MDGKVMTVKALMGSGERIRSWYHGNRIRLVHHVEQPPGSPLGAEICKARVYRPRHRWWWECRCGESGSAISWWAAFKRAHRHVRMSWLIGEIAELEQQEREEQDCSG